MSLPDNVDYWRLDLACPGAASARVDPSGAYRTPRPDGATRGRETVEAYHVVADLVCYGTERWEHDDCYRDSYVPSKRAGEQLLVSYGWRFLAVESKTRN